MNIDESPEITTFELTSSAWPPMKQPQLDRRYVNEYSSYSQFPGYNQSPGYKPPEYNRSSGYNQSSGYNPVHQPRSPMDMLTTWDTSTQMTTFPTSASTQEFHVEARQMPCSTCKGTGRQNIKF